MAERKQEKWQLADAYSYLDGLGSRGIAWEFMRRNSDYRAAWRSMVAGIGASLARRWGCVVDPDLRADHAPVAWLLTTEQP
jgi:hypothetical protein